MTPHDLITRHRRLATLFVGLLAVAAFAPSLRNGFVYDDGQYILKNPLIASWSWDHLRTILTQSYFGNFHPLHLIVYVLERSTFGLRPMGWHVVSVALHAVNAMLLYRLLPRFGVGPIVALVGTAIFAVHPVQTESVAWISEQKNLLSLLFSLLSVRLYLNNRASGHIISLVGSTATFLAALASKVSAIGLVPFFFAVEFFAPPMLPPPKGRTFVRILPFVLLAGIWVNLTILAHGRSGFIYAYHGDSLGATLLSAGPVLVAYTYNILWPMKLSAVYDLRPATEIAPAALLACWILVLFALAGVVKLARFERERRIALGLVWVLAFLLPVMNLIPIGTLMNDRYLYIPMCAIGPMGAGGILALFRLRRSDRGSRVLAVGVAFLLAVFVIASSVRTGVWKDDESLWRDATAKYPRSGRAFCNLGTTHLKQGDLSQAERELRMALDMDPYQPRAYHNLGVIHSRERRFHLAVAEFKAATKLAPRSYDAWINLAVTEALAGNLEAARTAVKRAHFLDPRQDAPVLLLQWLRVRKGGAIAATDGFQGLLSSGTGSVLPMDAGEGQLRKFR